MAGVSTHVLDTALGLPAAGVAVVLERRAEVEWIRVGAGTTDADGRVRDLGPAAPGAYRLRFDTGAYFRAAGVRPFYPEVHVIFDIDDPSRHHHVPLLLSPFGYSTYRGS